MGIGMRELLVILVVCLLVFGTKKLKTIGADLGGAVRGFKKAMEEGESEARNEAKTEATADTRTADARQIAAEPAPRETAASSQKVSDRDPTG